MSGFLGYAHLTGFQHGKILEALRALERGNVSAAQVALHDAQEHHDEQTAEVAGIIAAQKSTCAWLQPLPIVSPPVAPGAGA